MSLSKRLFNQGKRLAKEKFDKYIDEVSCGVCSREIKDKGFNLHLNGDESQVCSVCMENITKVRETKALEGNFDEWIDIGYIRSLYSPSTQPSIEQTMDDFLKE